MYPKRLFEDPLKGVLWRILSDHIYLAHLSNVWWSWAFCSGHSVVWLVLKASFPFLSQSPFYFNVTCWSKHSFHVQVSNESRRPVTEIYLRYVFVNNLNKKTWYCNNEREPTIAKYNNRMGSLNKSYTFLASTWPKL